MKLMSLVVVGLWLAVIIGWVRNVIDVVTILTSHATAAYTGLDVLHFAGVVIAPLGAVLGWM